MDQLLELLRERGFRRGHFVLSSGKESDFFIDCKPAVLLAEGHPLVGKALSARIREALGPVSAVAGVELGGCPLASAVAYASFEEHLKGMIRPGMLADMVLLDRDLTTIDPNSIRGTKVLVTAVGGKVVFTDK